MQGEQLDAYFRELSFAFCVEAHKRLARSYPNISLMTAFANLASSELGSLRRAEHKYNVSN